MQLSRFLLALPLCVSCTAWSQDAHPNASLPGVWQDIPFLAAGWSNTYQFFSDGTFKFNANQMNCASRELWSSGKWRFTGGKLILEVNRRRVVVGGRIDKNADPICGPKIVGGIERTEQLKPRREEFEVGIVRNEEQGKDQLGQPYNFPSITLRKKFWKLYDDPQEYVRIK